MQRRLGCWLLALAVVLLAPLAQAAPGWRPNPNPFRVSQAPAGTPAAAPATATPATTPAPAPKAGDQCRDDNQCPAGTICDQGRCTAVEPPIHALLFRKEGGSTAFYPFYFARRGNPGHRVIAPFYWHFWSPEGKSRVVAPFYWRFEDYAARRVVLVIPPFSHTVQPDAESWAVWPFLYRSTKFGWAAPLLLSFKIGNPDEGRALGMYALLYFWKRDHKAGTAFDLLFPLFASSRSRERAFTWALPLNFYWRRGEQTHLLLTPLLYRQGGPAGSVTASLLGYGRSDKDSSSGSILWLYWWGRNPQRSYDLAIPLLYWSRGKDGGTLGSLFGYYSRAGENRRGSFLWLYWFGRKTNGSKYDVLFPALWSFRSPTSNTTVIPPVLHFRRSNWSLTTVFPVYWAGRDHEHGSSWRLLVPLFYSRTGEQGRTFTWLTPLGGYRRNEERSTRTLLMLVPPMLFRRDPQRELDMVAFLYWRYRNPTDGSSRLLLGNFYRSTDPEGSTTTLFPLFWHFRDAATGSTAHTLFPLYLRRSGPDQSLTAAGVFPLWAYFGRHRDVSGAQGNNAWSAGLFPLAFFGSGADRGHGVVFPLFWHFRNVRGTSTVAAPVFFRFADRRSTIAGVPPLLYFYGRDGEGATEERYHVQIPFFWRFSSNRTGTATTVVPPFYYTSGGRAGKAAGWSAGLFPLLFAGKWPDRSHFVLFPLFWRFRDDQADRSSTLVLNYMHRRHGGETTDALFPLLYYRRGARPGGQPEASFTLFPLLHYNRTPERRLLLTPLAFSARWPGGKAGFIPPYLWLETKHSSFSGVPPLYLDFTRRDTGERTRLFGPLVFVDSPTSRARVLFPVFGRYSDQRERGTWVFPSYFHRRTNDGYAVDTLFPLFWHSSWPGHSTTVVGPYYRRTGPDSHATGLVPLFFYARNPERRFILTPLFYQRSNYKEETSRLFALPLFYRSTNRDGHRTVLFPILWAGRNGPRRHTVVFPLAWMFSNQEEDSSFNLIGPIFWSHHGRDRTRGLMPLAWYSRDDEQRTTSVALMPLFYTKIGTAQSALYTLPFGFRRAPDRHWWYALNVFHRDTVQSSFTMVFPLYFGHFNKGTETSTRVIPPLLHFSRSRPDRALSGWLLLFWRHRDISSATTLGLPLFYDIYNYHQNRLTVLAPVFFRYWRAQDNTAYNFAPFFYRRSSPDDSTTVAFPLYWDFKGKDRRTTIAFPLFVGVRRPEYLARWVFPNIYWSSGLGKQAGISRLMVFPLWESRVKRPGDYMWEVLLGLVGYERIGRNRFLWLFFIPFKLEPAPAAQTAWYGRHRPLVRHRRYGLDTRSW